MLNRILLCLLLCQTALLAQEIAVPFKQVPNQPYFQSSELMVDSTEKDTLVLTLNSRQGGTARLFWANHYDPQFNQQKSLWFFVKPGIHDYYFNLAAQSQSWIGWAKGLLIYPEFPAAGLEIGQARLQPGNLSTGLASAWQEFWGPKGRLIEGPSVNNMRALTFWGKPVNFLFYWLIGLTALLSFGYFFLVSRDLGKAWSNCGRVTVLSGLFCWALLVGSQLANESRQFNLDLAKYGWQPLAAKQAAAVEDFGSDFYPFLVFCADNLPDRARVKFLNTDPTGDYPLGRAKYFLYPIDFYAKVTDYLIVFHYQKELAGVQAEYPGFRLFKKYNERAYILWKK